jgi:glycogen debranching enzyme
MTIAAVRPDILYAWKGPALLIVTRTGEAGETHALSGFYFREARVLSTCRIEINGQQPWLCEASAPAPDRLQFVYTHPEVADAQGGGSGQASDDEPRDRHGVPQRAIDVVLTYEVGLDGLHAIALVGNRSRESLDVEFAWALDADFADIQEAQAASRQQHALVQARTDDRSIEFTYRHEQLPYRTRAVFSDGAWQLTARRAAQMLKLAAGQRVSVQMHVHMGDKSGSDPDFAAKSGSDPDLADPDLALQAWRDSFTRLRSPRNTVFEQAFANNVRDFASFPLLEGQPDEWLALQAGVPLYPALFGRDAVTAGWQAACIDRGQSLDAALTRLGRMQSDRLNDWRDEEPGRIPYQVRRGPLAILNLNPYASYYADFASPLMFVISLANLYAWTGDARGLRRHWDVARRILDWAREYGDRDRDGYLEYETRSRMGTKNQGWKDSGDAIVYDDGTTVEPPIATCEIQGYWYLAQQLMGALSWMLDASRDARAYFSAAADLKARFNRDWWIEADGFFALAMDPDKQLVRAATSNVGHCLATGIIDRPHLPSVVGRLFAPDMFSGWGIRTLSAGHRYYNPLSYHRGTVWAVEQATIVFGLRRFGFDSRALELAQAVFDLATLYPEYRIPECVGGYARGEQPTPGAYPQANTPQLWNATVFPLIVQTLTGLVPVAPYETLIVDPVLPDWLPELILENLRVGGATVTLRFHRDAHGRSDFDVIAKHGTLHILRQPPPEALTAGVWQRLRGAMESMV